VIRFHDRAAIITPITSEMDELGGSGMTWTNAPEVLEPCTIQPLNTSEYAYASDDVTSRWRARFLPTTTLSSEKRVRWRGLVLEVDGEVQLLVDRQGRPHHNETVLELVRTLDS
jgi:hypothetical protein